MAILFSWGFVCLFLEQSLISYYFSFWNIGISLLKLVWFCLSAFLIMCKIKNGLYSNLFSSDSVVCNLDFTVLYNCSNWKKLLEHLMKLVSRSWLFCFRPLCCFIQKFILSKNVEWIPTPFHECSILRAWIFPLEWEEDPLEKVKTVEIRAQKIAQRGKENGRNTQLRAISSPQGSTTA